MKVKDFINKVNTGHFFLLEDVEHSIENIPELVASGIDLESNFLYNTAVNVYKCEDGFVGVFGIFSTVSPVVTMEDLDTECEAEEYKEVQSVTYVPKKQKF